MRAVILWLSPEDVLGLFRRHRRDVVTFPILEAAHTPEGRRVPIPEGVEIHDVFYDWQRRQFGFRLYHDSFAAVPAGKVPPSLFMPDLTVLCRPLDADGRKLDFTDLLAQVHDLKEESSAYKAGQREMRERALAEALRWTMDEGVYVKEGARKVADSIRDLPIEGEPCTT